MKVKIGNLKLNVQENKDRKLKRDKGVTRHDKVVWRSYKPVALRYNWSRPYNKKSNGSAVSKQSSVGAFGRSNGQRDSGIYAKRSREALKKERRAL